jgi:hypothetical protein
LEAAADGISGEQTWPSEEEMKTGTVDVAGGSGGGDKDFSAGRTRRVVPTKVKEAYYMGACANFEMLSVTAIRFD